jgi:hypothetical protein
MSKRGEATSREKYFQGEYLYRPIGGNKKTKFKKRKKGKIG